MNYIIPIYFLTNLILLFVFTGAIKLIEKFEKNSTSKNKEILEFSKMMLDVPYNKMNIFLFGLPVFIYSGLLEANKS